MASYLSISRMMIMSRRHSSSSKMLLRRSFLLSLASNNTNSNINSNANANANGISSSSSRLLLCRLYSSNPFHLESETKDTTAVTPIVVDEEVLAAKAALLAASEAALLKKNNLRSRALLYNNERADYLRQVSKLRSHYKEEVAVYQAQDDAEKEALVEATTRRRLERQRAKNERTFQNAIRQKELRKQQAVAFEDHLLQQQEIRTANKIVHQRARQLILVELEEESKLWLSSVEDVEKVFGKDNESETEQLLWAKPQGVIGVPNPSLDSHFWSYEGHTWDRSKTYKTKSEMLLQKLEDKAYDATNIDTKKVWTLQKTNEHDTLVRKAKLRALVRQAGRRSLLQRQKEYLDFDSTVSVIENEDEAGVRTSTPQEPPKPIPVPSLAVLANIRAQEKEGSELLLQDPTKFFIFENTTNGDASSTGGGGASSSDDIIDSIGGGDNKNNNNKRDNNRKSNNKENSTTSLSYSGSSLGTPIDLFDPLRTGQPQGRVYPIPIGKLPKPDLRTEKEKKRHEREERLWAAANVTKESEEDELLIAEEDRVFGEEINYEDANENWDTEDDDEWRKGLDPNSEKDALLLKMPREFRYKVDDIDEVITQLETKTMKLQSHLSNSIKTMEQEARSRIYDTNTTTTSDSIVGKDTTSSIDDDDDDNYEPFFDEETTKQLTNVGANVDKYETLMSSLTREQLLSMFALEGKEVTSATLDDTTAAGDGDGASLQLPTTTIFEDIPGLSEQQIIELTELESFIRIAEKQEVEEEPVIGTIE
mmetsp:Transcript_8232/g.9481  ORF Transcript_8232/g.9481 Transcript_8232/m.9481 type:complete len:765 (-) Transcript_8232:364-2658(-)